MAVVEGLTDAFVDGLQDSMAALSGSVIKVALYTPSANIGPATAAYTPVGEVSGTGYTAGGFTLALQAGTPVVVGDTELVTFDELQATYLTIADPVGGLLVYNSTTGDSIAVYGCGPIYIPRNGNLTIRWNALNSGVAPIKVKVAIYG